MPDQLLRLGVKIRQWVVDESGQDLMEYGLLVVLASLIAISLQQQLAAALVSTFTKSQHDFNVTWTRPGECCEQIDNGSCTDVCPARTFTIYCLKFSR